MKNYIVYFEIFGKKMKTTVFAETMTEAKQNVINKIKWHKVDERPKYDFKDMDEAFNSIMDLLGVNKHVK